MPRTLLVTAACMAGLVAGCGGSSTKPHDTPTRATDPATATTKGPTIATTGVVGKVPPAGSAGYKATKGSVLFHIRVALVRYFTSKGLSGVTTQCRGLNLSTASCDLTATNESNQTGSTVLTLSVSQTNGLLRITRVG
jgi:hypothetical protein